MLMQQTLSQLKALKLDGMARAFEEQAALTASTSLSFEERFGMVVDREIAWRDTRRLERLLKSAKLKNPQACIEDIEYRQSRGLDKGSYLGRLNLLGCQRISLRHAASPTCSVGWDDSMHVGIESCGAC